MSRAKAYLAGWRGIALFALVVLVVWLAGGGLPDGRLHVYFLDVGQGDAIFIRAPDGRQILVDGGPGPTALLNELGEVMPFWDRSLDLVVLTHPDADHMSGLVSVLERFRVGQVLDTYASDVVPDAASWRTVLLQAGVPRVYARPGMRLPVGNLSLTVLHAGPSQQPGEPVDTNGDSIVLRVDYGETGFLLTADADEAVEAGLLAAGAPLQADVLKVGHHGGNGSTSAPFVAAVAPRLAVIQVGVDNRFGHPHPDILRRLAGIGVARTDLNGRIEVTSDGRRLWVATARPSAP